MFCMRALRMLRRLLTFPISFAETGRSCSRIDGSCIPCLMKLQVSLSSLTFCLVLILWHQFPAGFWRILLSIHLRVTEFESENTSCLVALTTSFLSSAYSGLTRDSKLCEEVSSLLCSRSRNTRNGFAFAVGKASCRHCVFAFQSDQDRRKESC